MIVVNLFKYSLENPVRDNRALNPFSFSFKRDSKISFFNPQFSISFFMTNKVSLIELIYPS